jgi:hypothetical protein
MHAQARRETLGTGQLDQGAEVLHSLVKNTELGGQNYHKIVNNTKCNFARKGGFR